MTIISIIEKKAAGLPLTEQEIQFFVHGFSRDVIPDYQISSLLMAIKLKGMSELETSFLTKAMVSSGDTVDLDGIVGTIVDKHSTGGVGDKTSLVIGPILASLGLKLAKMSGRGLGHTGGTIDKLESIPGLTTQLSSSQFKQQVNHIGMAIVGQTHSLVPADKKLYALRDVTGTIDSIPLISSSIMSKKIASGAKTILLDVKFGTGAFMKTIEEATLLAKAMVGIGQSLGRNTRAMLTDMNQPLGFAIGNRLEVIEAMDTLQLKGPADLLDLSVQACAMILKQTHLVTTLEEGIQKVNGVLQSGKAYETFISFIHAQGGEIDLLLDPNFLKTKWQYALVANQEGFVNHINTLALGQLSTLLGAGRLTKEDAIDFNAGIIVKKKIGDHVRLGDTVAMLYSNQTITNELINKGIQSFTIHSTKPLSQPIIHGWIES